MAGRPRPDREIATRRRDDALTMDFSKFKTADWLVIVGGAMMFIAGFLDWFDAGPLSPNAFDFTFTGLIPWLLLVAAAVLGFLVAGELITSGGPVGGRPARAHRRSARCWSSSGWSSALI